MRMNVPQSHHLNACTRRHGRFGNSLVRGRSKKCRIRGKFIKRVVVGVINDGGNEIANACMLKKICIQSLKCIYT